MPKREYFPESEYTLQLVKATQNEAGTAVSSNVPSKDGKKKSIFKMGLSSNDNKRNVTYCERQKHLHTT